MGTDRLYSTEEDNFIRQHYTTTPHRDIADQLGRTVKSIRRRAAKIGAGRCKPKRNWSPEEDAFILASKGKPLADVANALKRDQSDTAKRARKLGFVCWRRPDGGNYVDTRGYEVERFENGKAIFLHRLIAERMLGRQLYDNEIVHHINMDKRDNRRENLYVFSSPAEHARCHDMLRRQYPLGTDFSELFRLGEISFDRIKGVYKCEKQVSKEH